MAEKMIDSLNKTFIDTSRIEVSYAKDQSDPDLPRAWSKHTKMEPKWKDSEEKKKEQDNMDEEKKWKFEEFVKVMSKKSEKVKT